MNAVARDNGASGGGGQVAGPAAMRLIAAAGLGGASFRDAANIAAGDDEVQARACLLDEVARGVPGWPGPMTPVLQWVAAEAPEGERRERDLCAATAAAGAAAAVERQHRTFCAGPLAGLLGWLRECGEAWLGLGVATTEALARAMLEAAPPAPPAESLAAAARFALGGGPAAAPAPGEMMARLARVVGDMGLFAGAGPEVRFLMWRGRAPRGRCQVVGGAVVAEVELSGRYRDVVTIFHEAGHAAHFAHAGTKGPGTAGIVVAEGFAHLLGQLGRDPLCAGAWVAGHEHWAAASRMVPRRSAAAKWQSALSCGDDPRRGLQEYAAGQSAAFSAPFAPGLWLADDGSAHGWLVYLLATCLAASLTAELRRREGREWFRSRRAGDLVRGWMAGDARRPAEFLRARIGRGIDLRPGL